MPQQPERRPLPANAWHRGEDPEFVRLANFTDAVYAIALTLLVLDMRVDGLTDRGDPGEMWDALQDLIPHFVAFAVAFMLLGRYWIAHHDFYARLRAIDRTLMALSLVYLASVAFLPFPTSLIGEFEENPVSLLLFATALAVVSGMETVMFAHAYRAGLLRVELTPDVYRWGVLASLQPVVMFVITMPFAFLSTTGVLLSWTVIGPLMGRWISRRAPADTPGADLPLLVRKRAHLPTEAGALGGEAPAVDDPPDNSAPRGGE